MMMGKRRHLPNWLERWEKRDKAVEAPGGIDARHAELMKTTDPQRIADYDAKHGQGAYSSKLKEKLGKVYSSDQPSAPAAPAQTAIKSTGKVVGRENLPPATSCLLYTSPSPRDRTRSRMPSSA